MSILKDYRAYLEHTNSAVKPFFKILFYCNIFFRISHILYKIKLVPLSRFFWLLNRILFSVDIDPRATLKGGFVMLHGVGIVIGRYVIAENRFKIYQGATLGGNNNKEANYNNQIIRQPVLKDGVVIGINAAVLGPIILEAGVTIGANAVVTKSMPENAIVVSTNFILNKKTVE